MKQRITWILLAGLTVVALATSSCEEAAEYKGLTSGRTAVNEYPDLEPGESKVALRPYSISPPVITHSVADLRVTLATNDCLECHLEGGEMSEGHIATKVPDSHFTDLHTGKKTQNLQGLRKNCLQCHVPQVEEAPVVENDNWPKK